MKKFFKTFLLSCLAACSYAQDGSLDLTFDPGTSMGSGINTTAIQSDGKIIIGGTDYSGGMGIIARLNTDGSSDATFNIGTGLGFFDVVNTTAIQSDGKIIIAGQVTSYNGTATNHIARLNTDGSLDNTFNIGTGPNSIIYTTAIQSDGKIIIGGAFTSYNGTARNRIARLNTDGSLDNTFNIGTGANDEVISIAIQSDGKIIIGGLFTSYNGTARTHIARLNADGSLDNTFNPGSGADGLIRTTAIQSDGKIIIGGDFTTYNGTARNYITRLNTDGSLDNTFNIGTGANFFVRTIAIQSDGKIIIGGSFSSYNGTARNCIARLNTDGSLDNTFNIGTGANGNVQTTAIQSDGKIIIGGGFFSYNGTARNGVARINSCLVIPNISGANTICSGGSTVLTASGGASYVWSTGENTAAITISTAGTYTVTATGVGGCTASTSIVVSAISGSTGTFTHTAIGSYTWIDGNTYTTSNNTATYTYVGGAANGCDSVVTLNLTILPSGAPLAATVTKTNNSCNGDCAGTATVTATGGAAPYTYLWSNGQTTQTATGLCYGAYNVVVTDALGTTVQKSSIFILQPSAISVAATINHKTCVAQGSISAVVSGGTGAKTLLWSTGATAGSITGLAGNTYGLTVTDAAGCQKAFSYFVDDLCYVISISKNDINTCTSTCIGDATVTATEGVAPYTYLWSNGQTTATATGLCKQNYRVTVTDANNIVRIGTVSIAHSQLAATYTATQLTCNGNCNGSATIVPTGAQAPYTFVWNSNAGSQTTQTATGLCAGAYNVTITSANGCTMVKKFINVGQPPAISLATSSTPASCANDGTAIVSVTNGVAPLTYAWSNGGNTADIASLAPGTYTVTVTDANGCMKTKTVTVGTTCGAKPTENGDLLAEESILDESMPTEENTDINETLRLNDFALVDAFNVYPNPNNGLFTIDIQLIAETDARLRIHDVLGRTLLEQNLQGQSFQVAIDAKTWTSGAYFVQLISADGQTTRKVLISNE